MVCNYQESFVHPSYPCPSSSPTSAARSCLELLSNRWTRCFTFSALTVSLCSFTYADEPALKETMPLETVLVSPAGIDSGSLVLEAPSNAGSNSDSQSQTETAGNELQDSDTGLRVAKRPWLLEKLVGPEKDKSIKWIRRIHPAMARIHLRSDE